MPNVNSIPKSPICDLADIVTARKVLSTLSDVEKYQYLTKHYSPTDKVSLFQKRVQKGGETKTLTYQLSWIQKNDWHVYSKELQEGLYKYCALFDDDGTHQRGKFLKTVFQNIGKSEVSRNTNLPNITKEMLKRQNIL